MYALDAVKSVSGGTCPVIVWVATPMHAFLRFAGPAELGGFGDIGAAMEAAAQSEGRTIAKVASRMSGPVGADVVRLPGLPDMYHYEYHPQEVRRIRRRPGRNVLIAAQLAAAVSSALVIKDCHRFVLAADGIVVVATSAFERGSIEAGRAWLAGHMKHLWAVGPLEDVLPAMTAPVHNMEGSHDQGHSVSAFLDQMEQTHGAHSVIFVCPAPTATAPKLVLNSTRSRLGRRTTPTIRAKCTRSSRSSSRPVPPSSGRTPLRTHTSRPSWLPRSLPVDGPCTSTGSRSAMFSAMPPSVGSSAMAGGTTCRRHCASACRCA
jgi:hypothetical protein